MGPEFLQQIVGLANRSVWNPTKRVRRRRCWRPAQMMRNDSVSIQPMRGRQSQQARLACRVASANRTLWLVLSGARECLVYFFLMSFSVWFRYGTAM